MSSHKVNNKRPEIIIEGDRKDIFDFLDCKSKDIGNAPATYSSLYYMDYQSPIRTSPLKVFSYIFALLFICSSFLLTFLKEWIAVSISGLFIFLILVIFNRVRKVKYPNEQYSIIGLILVFLIECSLIALAFLHKETMISNWYSLELGSTFTAKQINQLVKPLIVYFYTACGLSFVFLLIGTLISRRRLASIVSPMVVSCGFLLFTFIVNLLLEQKFIEKSFFQTDMTFKPFLYYLLLTSAVLALVVFDLVMIFIVRHIGGKKSYKRR